MGERLRERDPGDQLLVRAQRRLKGKTILFLDQLVFFLQPGSREQFCPPLDMSDGAAPTSSH